MEPRKIRVLIAEDNEEGRYLLETLLRGIGYEVVAVRNGAEALENLHARDFDIIITDIFMPVMDGFQLCMKVKQDDRLRKIPLVFYSAIYTDEHDEDLAVMMGAHKFIRKPVEPGEFARIISEVLAEVGEGKIRSSEPSLEREEILFQRYNERVVNKLEQKVQDLEKEITKRKKVEEALTKARDELEQRVDERTAELSALNKELAQDITDRKKAEEERETLRTQLFQAQKMESIGTLAGGIAHDFNNLLTIINGYTELILSEKTEDDPSYSDLQKILETGLKGADLVQRLLAFTKKGECSPKPLDVNRVVENSVALMERTFPKIIEVEATFEKDLGMVNADSAQVEQVLMNLCINAKEAMPEGGQIRIETRNTLVDEDYCRLHVGTKMGRHVLIEISDTGTGMSQETIHRIFDPFFTTKGWNYKKGTGLGLSVAKGIVEQHGGWITCESQPGNGTKFTIFLPAIEAPPEETKPKPEPETASVPGVNKILLADDEELVRDLGKRILERAGYTVITAENGKEALEIDAKERPNIGLVLLDLIMPQVGGEECLGELLLINPKVRVVVSSGHSLDPKELDRLSVYAKGFVNKPYEIKQLVRAVKRALDV